MIGGANKYFIDSVCNYRNAIFGSDVELSGSHERDLRRSAS